MARSTRGMRAGPYPGAGRPIATLSKGIPLRVPNRVLQHVCVAVAALSLPVLAPRAFHAWSPAAAAGGPDNAGQVSAVVQRPAGPAFTDRPAAILLAHAGGTRDSPAAPVHAA